MTPKFGNYEERLGAELLCPECGNNYVHHEIVEVFDRSEDEPQGLHVTVADRGLHLDRDISRNPSARRHGVRIQLLCESCNGVSVLEIVQHKGNTYLRTGPPSHADAAK